MGWGLDLTDFPFPGPGRGVILTFSTQSRSVGLSVCPALHSLFGAASSFPPLNCPAKGLSLISPPPFLPSLPSCACPTSQDNERRSPVLRCSDTRVLDSIHRSRSPQPLFFPPVPLYFVVVASEPCPYVYLASRPRQNVFFDAPAYPYLALYCSLTRRLL